MCVCAVVLLVCVWCAAVKMMAVKMAAMAMAMAIEVSIPSFSHFFFILVKDDI